MYHVAIPWCRLLLNMYLTQLLRYYKKTAKVHAPSLNKKDQAEGCPD
jgi:hypothetical protein